MNNFACWNDEREERAERNERPYCLAAVEGLAVDSLGHWRERRWGVEGGVCKGPRWLRLRFALPTRLNAANQLQAWLDYCCCCCCCCHPLERSVCTTFLLLLLLLFYLIVIKSFLRLIKRDEAERMCSRALHSRHNFFFWSNRTLLLLLFRSFVIFNKKL